VAQENVEIVRRSLEAFNHSGIEAALAFDDPDIEWITTGTYAEANTYRGHAGVREYIGSYEAEFANMRMRPEELIEVGDQVVASVRITGTGKRSRVPVELTLTSVCSLHDGKVVRIHNYADKAEALEAAGLRD
jgi:ketosteroid isomerase-like protein